MRGHPSGMYKVKVVNLTRGTVLAEESGVAVTSRARRRGLLGTTGLSPGGGLLIKPCRQVHTVGMKYTIDVLFYDGSWRVVRCVPGLKPGRFSPVVLRARGALELPAGTLRGTGTEKGDFLDIRPVPASGAGEEKSPPGTREV